jgi:branched-chain amino acid transport system substrate-binding protein
MTFPIVALPSFRQLPVRRIGTVTSWHSLLRTRPLSVVNWSVAVAFGFQVGAACAQTGEPIKIAGSFDLSGPAAALGQDAFLGAQFAVDVINKKGGVLGRRVALEHQDNGTNPQRAVDQATALVRDGAVMLISPISSGSTLAVSKAVSAKMKVPMCVAVSASENITGKDFQPYLFSMPPTTYMMMRAITVRLAKQPYKRYALIVPDYAGGRDASIRFKEFMKELNPQAQIVVEEYPKLGATDYTATINKVLAAQPDYVWTQVYGSDLLTFSKQAAALGLFKQINNKFMTVYDGNTLKALGNNAPVGSEGYQLAPFNQLLKSGADTRDIVTQFKAKTGDYPSDWSLLAYDCVIAWANAASAAKSTDADAVMRSIESTAFNSTRGALRFAKYDHEVEAPVYIGKVTQSKEFGQAVLDIEEVVPASTTHPAEAVIQKMRQSE